MTRILVTGASGFVGSRLVPALARAHDVVALSRKPVAGPVRHIQGSFDSAADLRRLDSEGIDGVVHLASEVGGIGEEAALSVNVLGAQLLLRHLAERGCRRFVLASSIAATGCLDPAFAPLELPIADRHPCLAVDPYGLSKYLVEQLAAYFARVFADAELVALRIGSLADQPGKENRWLSADQPPRLPFTLLGQVMVHDVVDAIAAVLAVPPRPGARVYNVVAPDIRSRDCVADVLRAVLGARASQFALDRYEVAGKLSPPIYALDALRADTGFAPSRGIGS